MKIKEDVIEELITIINFLVPQSEIRINTNLTTSLIVIAEPMSLKYVFANLPLFIWLSLVPQSVDFYG